MKAFDIKDILNKAKGDNEKERISKPKEETPPETEHKTGEDVSYATSALQKATAPKVETGYIRPDGSTAKVADLYKLLNIAAESDLNDKRSIPEHESSSGKVNPDAVKKAVAKSVAAKSADTGSSHFTEAPKSETETDAVQQKFYPFDKTVTLSHEKPTADKPTYDTEYDALSSKMVASDEFGESSDDGQLTFDGEATDYGFESTDGKSDGEVFDSDIELKRAYDIPTDEPNTKTEHRKNKTPKSKEKIQVEKKLAFEYVDRKQNAEVYGKLFIKYRNAVIRLALTVIPAILIFLLELADTETTILPEYLHPGRQGAMYALIDLQILCIMMMICLSSLKGGCVSLFKGKPTADSVLFVSFVVSASHAIVTAFAFPDASMGLFLFPCALMAVASSLIRVLRFRKDIGCFRVLSSKRPKYIAERLTGKTKESEEFYNYLFENSEIYTAKKTDFADGFYRRLETQPESEAVNVFFIWLSVIVAAIMFAVSLIFGASIYVSYTRFTELLVFALPVSSFFIIALPLIIANKIAKSVGSAFVGEAVGEEYGNASVISFSDIEVYPSNYIKIVKFKPLGNMPVDSVFMSLARIFDNIGGPLKQFTSNFFNGKITKAESFSLVESTKDGLRVKMDGDEWFLGKLSFITNDCRFPEPENDTKQFDVEFERRNGSIMYIMCNDEAALKVYFEYNVNPEFDKLLRDLYRAGMCVGIKTMDPNISKELVAHSVHYKRTPISILKSGDVADVEPYTPRADSGIVVNGSLHIFLRMFILCDKLRHISKANAIITTVSLFIAYFVAFFIAFIGQFSSVSSWIPALYQTFWLAPVLAVSLSM